jgi:hypothetical protein
MCAMLGASIVLLIIEIFYALFTQNSIQPPKQIYEADISAKLKLKFNNINDRDLCVQEFNQFLDYFLLKYNDPDSEM